MNAETKDDRAAGAPTKAGALEALAIPVPEDLQEQLQQLLRANDRPKVLTIARTGEATFATAAGQVSTMVDREAPTPLQRPPLHPPAAGFLEPLAQKLYAAKMAGYAPAGGGPLPWDALMEGTQEMWRNLAAVAILHIGEMSPPALDLSPSEVEALDQGVKAALTIGMLDPRRSATDRDATAKILRYLQDQRDRFATAAAAGEQLTFASAPSYPAMVQELGIRPASSHETLCLRPVGDMACVRFADHSETGTGCTIDVERARELDARDFKRAR